MFSLISHTPSDRFLQIYLNGGVFSFFFTWHIFSQIIVICFNVKTGRSVFLLLAATELLVLAAGDVAVVGLGGVIAKLAVAKTPPVLAIIREVARCSCS